MTRRLTLSAALAVAIGAATPAAATPALGSEAPVVDRFPAHLQSASVDDYAEEVEVWDPPEQEPAPPPPHPGSDPGWSPPWSPPPDPADEGTRTRVPADRDTPEGAGPADPGRAEPEPGDTGTGDAAPPPRQSILLGGDESTYSSPRGGVNPGADTRAVPGDVREAPPVLPGAAPTDGGGTTGATVVPGAGLAGEAAEPSGAGEAGEVGEPGAGAEAGTSQLAPADQGPDPAVEAPGEGPGGLLAVPKGAADPGASPLPVTAAFGAVDWFFFSTGLVLVIWLTAGRAVPASRPPTAEELVSKRWPGPTST